MAKYRKKPIVIEAEQWFPGRVCEGVYWEYDGNGFSRPYVATIHGQRAYVASGDWIIPEPQEGRFYPCKPDIFATTYEPVDE